MDLSLRSKATSLIRMIVLRPETIHYLELGSDAFPKPYGPALQQPYWFIAWHLPLAPAEDDTDQFILTERLAIASANLNNIVCQPQMSTWSCIYQTNGAPSEFRSEIEADFMWPSRCRWPQSSDIPLVYPPTWYINLWEARGNLAADPPVRELYVSRDCKGLFEDCMNYALYARILFLHGTFYGCISPVFRF